MTWQPGQSTPHLSDLAMRQERRNTRILELQRSRRKGTKRIDYYPSADALEAIKPHLSNRKGGDYSSVINALLLAASDKLPEIADAFTRARVARA